MTRVGERAGYLVSLEVFEGPLDLLLHLIEREELDITRVSLAQVTNQYLEYLALLSHRDAANLAEFLVIAAQLLLIKSRALLPVPPRPLPDESEDEDEGEELVRQLIEYKQFKEAALWLRELEGRGWQSYVRMATSVPVERVLDLQGVTLGDLVEAIRRVLEIKPPGPPVDEAVPALTITVRDQMERIAKAVARRGVASFVRLLEGAANRLEVIVTLLAVLEMVKQGRIRMRQEMPFGDILLVARDTVPAMPGGEQST